MHPCTSHRPGSLCRPGEKKVLQSSHSICSQLIIRYQNYKWIICMHIWRAPDSLLVGVQCSLLRNVHCSSRWVWDPYISLSTARHSSTESLTVRMKELLLVCRLLMNVPLENYIYNWIYRSGSSLVLEPSMIHYSTQSHIVCLRCERKCLFYIISFYKYII